ncbi:glycosyltransferase family 2 protein [uncultured Winogradskyella sp.]|uniref:glycosyltransferase family 2 protein n=1 Tax=uncultured Winogradskyella sp. TaxID=395353 RepID=UPI00260EE862|nr:glycosyltransferase family 2 protein [uncultured Winogradskyella sp.]
MISILIPTYNYNITGLFKVLKTELEIINTDYEVICYEDGSSKHLEDNSKIINTIAHSRHIISKDNKGRLTTRQTLAEMAKYDWLLFLDSDVIPNKPNFLHNYINYLNSNYQAIYGGCSYNFKKPEKQFTLRWKYGKNYEDVDAEIRNKTPFKIIVSANFLIKKDIFLDINSSVENDGYGYDNFVAAFMKSRGIKVFHINNNVIHKGLDKNAIFLDKTEKAVDTIFEFNQKNYDTATENSLLELYRKMNSFRLSKVISFVFRLSKTSIKKQLLGSNPNLALFQFYKLGYLCSLTSSRK